MSDEEFEEEPDLELDDDELADDEDDVLLDEDDDVLLGDDLVEAIATRTRDITVGAGDDASSEMGPVITAVHRDKVLGYVDAGEFVSGSAEWRSAEALRAGQAEHKPTTTKKHAARFFVVVVTEGRCYPLSLLIHLPPPTEGWRRGLRAQDSGKEGAGSGRRGGRRAVAERVS
jgi:hypothetical protein